MGLERTTAGRRNTASSRDAQRCGGRAALARFGSSRVSDGTRTHARLDHNQEPRGKVGSDCALQSHFRSLGSAEFCSDW